METTWKGGRNGHLWSLVKSALETPEEQKGPLDWRVVFFPWQDEPSYCDAIPRPLSEETQAVLRRLRADFSPGQKCWYQRKRAELGNVRQARVSDHAWRSASKRRWKGAIYAEEIDKLRAEGAIRPWIVDNSALTHTCWDLGSPINTVVWYFQLVGRTRSE